MEFGTVWKRFRNTLTLYPAVLDGRKMEATKSAISTAWSTVLDAIFL